MTMSGSIPRLSRAGPAVLAPACGGQGGAGPRVDDLRSPPPTASSTRTGGERLDGASLSPGPLTHAHAHTACRACGSPHAALFDQMAFATLLLGFDGSILWQSANADSLLAENEGLMRRDGRLVGRGARDREALAAALDAMRRDIGKGEKARARLLSTTPLLPEEHTVVALVPLPPGHRADVALLLCPPLERRLLGAEAAAMQAFGLTRRESQIATALARGDSLADFCDERRLSLETARWHLRHILEKMSAARQGHVIARLLGSPVALLDGGADTSGG